MSRLTSAATRIRGRCRRGHALVKGKMPGHEPLPEGQGQAQQGEEAKNQVQDHGSLLVVIVRAIVIEAATGRKRKSEGRGPKEVRRPKPESRKRERLRGVNSGLG